MDFFPDEQELEGSLQGLRILDNTFSWLVYGAPETNRRMMTSPAFLLRTGSISFKPPLPLFRMPLFPLFPA